MVNFVLDINHSFLTKDEKILKDGLLNIETIEDLRDLLQKVNCPITLCAKDNYIEVTHPYDF
jgi:hypothetical protein